MDITVTITTRLDNEEALGRYVMPGATQIWADGNAYLLIEHIASEATVQRLARACRADPRITGFLVQRGRQYERLIPAPAKEPSWLQRKIRYLKNWSEA